MVGVPLVAVWLLSTVTAGQYGELRPVNVTDQYENFADRVSAVTWAAPPEGEPYGTVTEYDDGGLGPLYRMVKRFIYDIQSLDHEFMLETYQQLSHGNLDAITQNYGEYIFHFVGIIACLAFGLIYVIVMPIAGVCFCCVRKCGKCGGKLKQKESKRMHLACALYSVALLLITAGLGAGTVCTYFVGDQLNSAFDLVTTMAVENLGNADIFVRNTVDEIDFVLDVQLNFTVDVVNRDLDNVGHIIGDNLVARCQDEADLDDLVMSAITLGEDVRSLSDDLEGLNVTLGQFESATSQLSSDMNDVVQAINDADPGIDTTPLDMHLQEVQIPDIGEQLSKIKQVANQNFSELVIKQQEDSLKSIPEKVHNATRSIVKDIRDSVLEMKAKVLTRVSELKAMPDKVSGGIQNISQLISDIFHKAKDYNDIRQYSGLLLSSVLLLILALQLGGLTLGQCMYTPQVLPTERGPLSNCAGLMLMLATTLIFLFSWLLMLLCMALFAVGAPLQVYLCGPLDEPNLHHMQEVLDTPGVIFDDFPLGAFLVGNGSVPIKITEALLACREDQTVWRAFKLDKYGGIYLPQLDNIMDQASFGEGFEITGTSIFSDDLVRSLDDLQAALDLDAMTSRQQVDALRRHLQNVDLKAFARDLRAVDHGTAQASLDEAANRLEDIADGSFVNLTKVAESLVWELGDVAKALSETNQSVAAVRDDVNHAYVFVTQTLPSRLVPEAGRAYMGRLFGTVKQYVAHVNDTLQSSMGRCGPLYDIWYSTANVAVCMAVVDTMNGFWAGLGWSAVFLFVSLILDVKLARYFRKMRFRDGYEELYEESKDR